MDVKKAVKPYAKHAQKKNAIFSEQLTARWQQALAEYHAPQEALKDAIVTIRHAKRGGKKMVVEAKGLPEFTLNKLEDIFEASGESMRVDAAESSLSLTIRRDDARELVDFFNTHVLQVVNPDLTVPYAALLHRLHGHHDHGYHR